MGKCRTARMLMMEKMRCARTFQTTSSRRCVWNNSCCPNIPDSAARPTTVCPCAGSSERSMMRALQHASLSLSPLPREDLLLPYCSSIGRPAHSRVNTLPLLPHPPPYRRCTSTLSWVAEMYRHAMQAWSDSISRQVKFRLSETATWQGALSP